MSKIQIPVCTNLYAPHGDQNKTLKGTTSLPLRYIIMLYYLPAATEESFSKTTVNMNG
jgi:hypothetical protein